MQRALPRATPPAVPPPAPPPGPPPPLADQITPDELNEVNADPGLPYRGWYPRWWLLSGIVCSILIGVLALLQPILCGGRLSGGLLCQVNTWQDWRQGLVVALIWAIFLLGWLLSYLYGVNTIEISQGQRTPIAHFLRTISEFKTTSFLLTIYGTLALISIIVTWYFNRFQPAAYALASIAVFIASSGYMHSRKPEERRSYVLGYIVLAILSIIILFWIGPFQPTIFTSAVIVILVSLFIIRRTRRQPRNARLNPVQQYAASNVKAASPAQLFLGLISAFRGGNQANPAQAQNTPNQPGTPPPIPGGPTVSS